VHLRQTESFSALNTVAFRAGIIVPCTAVICVWGEDGRRMLPLILKASNYFTVFNRQKEKTESNQYQKKTNPIILNPLIKKQTQGS